MFSFFDKVLDFFDLIWSLVTNIINSIVPLVTMLTTAYQIPIKLVAVVPGVIGTSILAMSALGIAKLLIGWGINNYDGIF